MKYIYLCGTITQDPVHQDWRGDVTPTLEARGWTVLDPMRGKSTSKLTDDGLKHMNLPAHRVVARDYADIAHADMVLCVYWKDPKVAYGKRRQSIGTWWELGMADQKDIPIVVVTDAIEVTDHPFITQKVCAVENTLADGLAAVEWIGGKWGDS